MKKLTLFLLGVLCSIGMAWGALNNTTVTHNDQHFLDVVSVTSSTGDEVTVSGQYAAYTISELVSNSIKGVWYSQVSSSGGSNESSAVTATGFRGTNSKYMSVTSTNTVTFYVKGCVGVAVLYDPRSSQAARKYTITATNVDNEEDVATITDTQATSSGNQYVVNLSNLSTSKYYKVVVASSASDGSRMFQFRVESATTTPSINASDVNLACNETSGEIAYSLKNATIGVDPTAEITSGSDWVSNMQLDTENGKISFSASENTIHAKRTATIKISYSGAEDKVVKITQAFAPISEIITVSSETNWDFTQSVVNGVTEIKFSEKDTEEIFGNKDGWKETFPADAMKGSGEYMFSSTRNNVFQGSTLIFKPTVAGIVTIKWGSTGTSARTLRINDEIMDNEGSSSNAVGNAKTSTKNVPAGQEVTIKGTEKSNDETWNLSKDGYLRIYSVKFTPAEQVSVSAADYATYTPATDVIVPEDGVVYYASAVSHDEITFAPLSKDAKVKAGDGLLIKGEGNHTFVYTTGATTLGATNKLVGVLADTDLSAVEGAHVLALDNGVAAFCPVSGGNLAAGKAYIVRPAGAGSAPMQITFTDEAEEITSIENVEQKATAVKFFENGQILILKNGNVYNVAGQIVR